MKPDRLVFLLPLLFVLLSCVTTGPGGKRSVILLSSAQEISLGASMARQVESNEKILDDPQWQSYLNEVGQRIVRVCDRKDLEFHFKVIESDQVNAFAAPGGFIYFYTGLLAEMDNEAELAAVMAHEISHVVARHSVKRIQKAMGVALVWELAMGDSQSGKALETAAGLGMGLLFAGYSRSAEREADRFGIAYMAKAGYDPNGSIGMFETLARLGGRQSQNFFENLSSSHPETNERISKAKAQISSMGVINSPLGLGRAKYQQMLKRLPD